MITSRVAPSRPARDVVRPVAREAEDRAAGARARVGDERQRGASRPGTRRTARSLRGSKATASRRSRRPAPAQQHRRVLLARDDVGVGDDEPVARDPAGALDAQPAGGAEDLARRSRAAARTCGSRAIAARGAGTSRLGPSIARERVEARQRLEQRPDGGSTSLSCRRIVERWTSRAQRRGSPASAARPRPPSTRARARRRAQQRAQQPVDDADPARAAARAQSRAEPLEPEQRAARRAARADQAEQRAYGECEPPTAAAGRAACRRTRRRRSPPSESAPTTKPWRSRTRPSSARRDDDPVERRHLQRKDAAASGRPEVASARRRIDYAPKPWRQVAVGARIRRLVTPQPMWSGDAAWCAVGCPPSWDSHSSRSSSGC